jgi:transposase
MRTSPYSTDLRIRVIERIKSGKSQASTSRLYKVSTSAVSLWWKRYKETKIVTARPRLGSKGKIDPQKLKKYIESNPDKTLQAMAIVFGVSSCAIHNKLKALGFSYKKKPSPMWKLAKKSASATKKR